MYDTIDSNSQAIVKSDEFERKSWFIDRHKSFGSYFAKKKKKKNIDYFLDQEISYPDYLHNLPLFDHSYCFNLTCHLFFYSKIGWKNEALSLDRYI